MLVRRLQEMLVRGLQGRAAVVVMWLAAVLCGVLASRLLAVVLAAVCAGVGCSAGLQQLKVSDCV